MVRRCGLSTFWTNTAQVNGAARLFGLCGMIEAENLRFLKVQLSIFRTSVKCSQGLLSSAKALGRSQRKMLKFN